MAFKTPAAVAGLTASNSNVTFGSVPVGKTANAYVKLVNQSSTAVTISQLQIAGKAFSSSAQDGLPITVGAQSSFDLGVQFNPSTAGTSSGQLTVMNTSNAGPLSVSLSGTGTAAPAAALSGLTCVNGSMTGSATDACTVTLDSAASSDTTINLTSDNSAVTLPATVTVPAGSSIAGFTATVSAVSAVQTVTLTASAAGGSKTFTLQLGAVAPMLTISSASVAFGNVPLNSPASQTLTLSSTGTAAVTVSAAAVTGSGFAVSGAAFPLTMNPGQATTLTVQFNPTAAGTAIGQLTLSSNSSTGSSSVVSLSGTGLPVLSGMSCTNGSFAGAGTDACTVTLNSAAATGGFVVNLASNNIAVTVPASVMVPAGAISAGFTANVSTATSDQTAILTASAGSAAQTFTLHLGNSVPTLTISAASVAFGNMAVNSPATQSLTLSSTGTASVTVSAASVTGAGFTISGAAFPLTLNTGQTVTLMVRFNPTVAGAATGQLMLTSNSSSGTSSVVSLSGTGIPVLSALNCTSGSMSGAGTDSCTVTLNAAAATGGFAVSLASTSSAVTVPASVTVPAGASSVVFTAAVTAVTTAQTATLTAGAGSVSKTFAIQLNASVPTLTISAASVAFGNVAVSSSATQTLTLSSTGSSSVTVSAASLTGSGITVTGAAFPLTLNPGQMATLTVRFNPAVAGVVSGLLTLTSNSSSGTSSIIAISGTGVPILSGLSCTSGSMTGAGTDSCTVTLNAAAAAGGFIASMASNNTAVAVPVSVTVPAGASSTGFTATVSTVTTAQTATLTASAGGVSKTFALQLNTNAPTLTVNATTLAFGSVNLNIASTQTITLTSTGTSAVTISAISVTGTGFTVSGIAFPLTINPSQTATLNVVFNPTTAGAVTGQLTITSNSSTGNTVVGLSGTGGSTTYEVDVSWLAPAISSDPVAGYIVFRANSGSSSYQQMNATAVTQTAFVDTTVQSGQSYSYMVESVDAAGTASVPSNIASAVIP